MDNTQQYYGLKELNSVVIRAHDDTTIGNKSYKKGEPVLYFEKIQISGLQEHRQIIAARGGHGNPPHVIWENFNDLSLKLTEGVMSKTSLSFIMNSGCFSFDKEERIIQVPKRQQLDVENGLIKPMYQPLEKRFFLYELNEDGLLAAPINDYVINNDKTVSIDSSYNGKTVLADYYFDYVNSYDMYTIGEKRINGLLSLEGKAYMKDDMDGLNRTFLFEIPKLKITSNLDIIMGEKASPTVSVFNIIGMPIKENNQWVVSKMYLLSDDIDSDI